MNNSFFKFPTTPHLIVLDKVDIREDKVMSSSERENFLTHYLVVEEKIDGANLGISFDDEGNIRAQNRGSYLELNNLGQWKHLKEWLFTRSEILFENLSNQYILFGEWCFAKHSIEYNKLPDYFLGFDIYDLHEKKFLSTEYRDLFLNKLNVWTVPKLASGNFTINTLLGLLTISKFSNSFSEGIYLRYDNGNWLGKRAKIVRPEFIQSIDQHWLSKKLVPNELIFKYTLK